MKLNKKDTYFLYMIMNERKQSKYVWQNKNKSNKYSHGYKKSILSLFRKGGSMSKRL